MEREGHTFVLPVIVTAYIVQPIVRVFQGKAALADGEAVLVNKIKNL